MFERILSLLILGLLLISCGTKTTPTYKVTTSTNPSEGGEIKIFPEGTVHDKGTELSLTPQPSEGFVFSEWNGDKSSTDNPLTFTLNEDVSVTGVFEKKTYSLNISTEGEGDVIERVLQNKDYEDGTVVELTADPSFGWNFIKWKGDTSSTENSIQLKMRAEKNITAVFQKKNFALDISITGQGEVTKEPNQQTYPYQSKIQLTAIPSEHWEFVKWDGIVRESQNPIEITISGNLEITAVFKEKTYPLNITTNGEGNVSERIVMAKNYSHGTNVELTANPIQLWQFSEWTEDIQRTENPTQVVIDSETNITASFEPIFNLVGGSDAEIGNSIIETNNGEYVATGGFRSNDGDFSGYNKGGEDIFVMKTDANKKMQWIKTFGGSFQESGFNIVQTSDGGFAIAGFSSSTDGDFSGLNNGDADIFVLKLDSNGNKQWIKTFGGSSFDYGFDMVKTSDGGFALTGEFSSNDGDFSGLNKGNSDAFVLKLDSSGNKQWIKTFGGNLNERGRSLTEVMGGGYVITGFFESNDSDFNGMNKGGEDLFVIKLDSNGNQKWLKTFGESNDDYGRAITETSDGNYLATGSSGINSGEIILIKLDSQGNEKWVNYYGGSDNDVAYSITNTLDGGFALTGQSQSNDGDFEGFIKVDSNIFVLKLDNGGNIQWNKELSGDSFDFGHSIIQSSNGSYYVTGRSNSNLFGFNQGNTDVIMIKYNPNQ